MWEIEELNQKSMLLAQRRWDSIAKPIGSLGLLEDAIIKVAGLTGNDKVCFDKKATLVMCADNGVVAQGISQVGSEVTAVVASNLTCGKTCLCRMSAIAQADVVPMDVGMVVDVEGVQSRKTAYGTQDISKGPAMTQEQALHAIQVGIDSVQEYKKKGYRLLATGEMGIGNTTTASAIATVLLNEEVQNVTGKGSGLTNTAFDTKKKVIQQAIDINKPNKDKGLEVLAKLGGFDIAAMAGMFIGGAIYRVPILIDGMISSVAALVAKSIEPKSVYAMLASHCSAEPAGKLVLQHLGLEPLLQAKMRLGEGTGAVAVMPILDMAVEVYQGMSSFEEINLDSYEKFDVT